MVCKDDPFSCYVAAIYILELGGRFSRYLMKKQEAATLPPQAPPSLKPELPCEDLDRVEVDLELRLVAI